MTREGFLDPTRRLLVLREAVDTCDALLSKFSSVLLLDCSAIFEMGKHRHDQRVILRWIGKEEKDVKSCQNMVGRIMTYVRQCVGTDPVMGSAFSLLASSFPISQNGRY